MIYNNSILYAFCITTNFLIDWRWKLIILRYIYCVMIQELMSRYRQLSPDGSECGCLKAIAVFKPGKNVYRNKFIMINIYNVWSVISNSLHSSSRDEFSINILNNQIIPFLFSCLETGGLSEVRPVELMQDQAQCILADYVRHR